MEADRSGHYNWNGNEQNVLHFTVIEQLLYNRGVNVT